LYSLPFGNTTLDKELCETPITNNGKCVDIIGIKSNGISLDSPY
jgi:hypothetical protein